MDFNKMVDMIKEAYVSVMGIEKWNSLSDAEKRLAVVTIAKDFDKAIK